MQGTGKAPAFKLKIEKQICIGIAKQLKKTIFGQKTDNLSI